MKKSNQTRIIIKSIVILLVLSTIITGLFSLGLTQAEIQINPQVTDLIQVTIETVDATGNHLDGLFMGANGIIGGTSEWVNTPHTLTIQNGGGTSYIVATWGGLTCYPGMSKVDKDVTYWYNARTSQVTQQNTIGTTKINIVFEPMQVVIDTVDQNGNHLSGLTSGAAGLIGGTYSWVNTPHELTLANGGSTGYLVASWGGLVAYPGMSAVNKDRTYWFDAITSQLQIDNTPGDCKINVVFLPANPLTVVPEYPLGALIALAACFVGLVVFKKHSCLQKLKYTT